MGLLTVSPNVLPILLVFGVLRLGGVLLEATTSLVACVVLGIAVDDASLDLCGGVCFLAERP
jgi:predicted RND superfamily exporter protein